jgi:hypothetical protein
MRWKTRGEADEDGLTAAESGTSRDWMSLRDGEGKERREEAPEERTRAVEVEAAGADEERERVFTKDGHMGGEAGNAVQGLMRIW